MLKGVAGRVQAMIDDGKSLEEIERHWLARHEEAA